MESKLTFSLLYAYLSMCLLYSAKCDQLTREPPCRKSPNDLNKDLSTLREVKFVGGVVGASSVYSMPAYQPANAFLQGSDKFWHSGRDSQGKGDFYQAYPHTIWYNFKRTFIPAGVAFRSRPKDKTGCGVGGCGPTKYKFVGTNDPECGQYSKWTVLCQDLSGIPFKYRAQSKFCDTDASMRESFSCYGIMVLESSYTVYSVTSISGIRMWAKE